MGIKIAQGLNAPAVIYDKIFVSNLQITQIPISLDNMTPKYKVFIEYRLYGVHEGARVYHPEMREVEINDFITTAMTKASTGDMSLVTALQSIETAVAAILTDELGTGTEVI